MPTTPHKSAKQFIKKLLIERDKFELLLNRVGFSRRMTLKGVSGKWSIKDILAHILAYEQYLADRMNEILQGEHYTPCKTQTALDAFLDEFGYPDFGSPLLDDDEPNTWVVERYQNDSMAVGGRAASRNRHSRRYTYRPTCRHAGAGGHPRRVKGTGAREK